MALAYIILLALSSNATASNIPKNPVTGLSISYQSREGQQCVGKNMISGGQSDRILQRFGVTINGKKSTAFEQGVASAVSMIASLGKQDLIQGLKVSTFPDGRTKRGGKRSCASYTAGVKTLNIVAGNGSCNRNISQTSATMHILHELGHSTGQQLGLYKSFLSSVGRSRCNVSGYCKHNNSRPGSEHFAETFAMYAHSPATLIRNCPSGYEFMKKNVFANKESNGGICKGTAAINVAGLISPGSRFPSSISPSSSPGDPSNGTPSLHSRSGEGQIGSLAQGLGSVLMAYMAAQNQQGANENPEVLQNVIHPTAPPTQNAHPASTK